jgi:hypothetical protein
MEHRCSCCKRIFRIDKRHPHQKFCSGKPCQRARRTQWQNRKVKIDPDYKANQYDAQRDWRKRNAEYWRKYRQEHPIYTERNRQRQKQHRSDRKKSTVPDPFLQSQNFVANMDLVPSQHAVNSGRYRIFTVDEHGVANMDAVIVQLSVIEQLTATA